MNTIHEGDLYEIENIYPSGITKEFIHASDRTAVGYIRRLADEICRFSINTGYIHRAFNKFKNGIIYKRDGVPHAFCIWKVKTHKPLRGPNVKEMLIYLVCAKKSDFTFLGLILDDLKKICVKEHVSFISLEPANDTVGEYYKSHGFTEGHIVNPRLLITQISNVSSVARNENRTSRTKTRRRRRT